ncbi:MAG TPA: RsmG family class I SAM-dependent methyltransferase, partial [Methylomirabilota bacterium]|nr:RsmG family class I SAM-dependent methyltransferase [Methylomirabilota bacterium]
MSKRDGQIAPIRGPEEFAAAFAVSRQVVDRLAVYESLLRQWQRTINLVAPSTLDAVWHRHFADSAQLVALAPRARTWVDLGSGAGFPGLVVAIMLAGVPPTSLAVAAPPTPNPSPPGGGGPSR